MSETFEFDLEGFESNLKKELEKNKKVFEGKYKKELNQLIGLSKEDIKTITPDTKDLQKYDELIILVKEASKVNLDQALLKEQILKLGSIAIQIAQKVPSLAAILSL